MLLISRSCRGIVFVYTIICFHPAVVHGSASTTTGCEITGLCHDTRVDQTHSSSLGGCVLAGRSMHAASWVSFNQALGVCAGFSDCGEIDSAEEATVSSQVDCRVCEAVGACLGVVLTFVTAGSSEDCLEQCGREPGCSWFSFNQDTGICDLLETCPRVDEKPGFVSGEVGCQATTTTTPTSTPTTSSPSTEDQEIVWGSWSTGEVRLGKIINQFSCVKNPCMKLNV